MNPSFNYKLLNLQLNRYTFWLALVTSLVVLPLSLEAQSLKKLNKKGTKLYERGDVLGSLYYYQLADSLYPDNAEVNLMLGKLTLETTKRASALPYLEKAEKLQPSLSKEMDLLKARAHQYRYEFDLAKTYYEAYLRNHPKQQRQITEALINLAEARELRANPGLVKIENLGPKINSAGYDYAPLITSDESQLIFTSTRSQAESQKKKYANFEEIYLLYNTADGWTEPEKISRSVNRFYNDAAAGLSPDGKYLVLFRLDNGGDLYLSQAMREKWSEPEWLPQPINSRYREPSASITNDGKRIYFSSDRPNGRGGLDIYYSDRLPDGSWGPAHNLGAAINTEGDEDAPFIHPDGQTLYFSSDGQGGLGGFDIFSSQLKDGRWQPPANMGYPINTSANEYELVVTGDKRHAYYSLDNKTGQGEGDIYRITFLDEAE
jgi:hypothetical protein